MPKEQLKITVFSSINQPAGSNLVTVYCCCSIAHFCLTLCDPMDCSTPGFTVHHQLLELAQAHVHWVSDTIQPSYPLVIPFSFCLQSFPVSGSFPMSRLFTSGGQSIIASASSLVLPMSIQSWFPLGLTGLISSCSRDSQRVFSNITILWSAFFMVQLSHLYMITGKTTVLTIWNCWQSDDSAFLYTV